MTVKILQGDCCEVMRSLDADSVDCVVTSPPYWGLRDYGVEGQLGLEPTLGEHIATMVDVFRGVKRVLKPTGTFWLNYGDCYATSPNGRSAADTKAAGNDDRTFRDKPFSTIGPIYQQDYESGDRRGASGNKGSEGQAAHTGRIVAGGVLKAKDLCMVPNRIAIALQEDGWWVRSEIVWGKPNPMPESIKDRPGTAHEKIFMFSKSARYYYGYEDVRQPMAKAKRQDGSLGRGLRNYEPAPIDVWRITTRPFKEAHFATFPPELAERCIKAGCPVGGVVLDPFFGAGTVGLVAEQLGRDCIGIELNPSYIDIAERRIGVSFDMEAELG